MKTHSPFLFIRNIKKVLYWGTYRKAVLYSTQKGREFSRPFCTLPCLKGVVCYTVLSVPGGKRMMFAHYAVRRNIIYAVNIIAEGNITCP
ncbi:MAG: hypothetical protein IJO74_03880 [Clostridia bacterium]|nr:hypothetical protein [Clostridia bacterium]